MSGKTTHRIILWGMIAVVGIVALMCALSSTNGPKTIAVVEKQTPASPATGKLPATEELKARYEPLCLKFQRETLNFDAGLSTKELYREVAKQIWIDMAIATFRDELNTEGAIKRFKRSMEKQFAEAPETEMRDALLALKAGCGEVEIFMMPKPALDALK